MIKKVIPFIVSSILISLATSFPGSLHFLAFIFLIPIIYYTDKKTWWGSISKDVLKMFLFSFVFVFISSLWIIEAYPLDWLGIDSLRFSLFIVWVIILVFSFVMSLPISLWILFIHKLKKGYLFFDSILAASAWVLLEYLRSFVAILSIWGKETLLGPHYTNYSLGYNVFNIPIIKELLPVGGIYLASFVIILINYLIYGLLLKTKKEKKGIFILFLLIIIITISSAFLIKKIRASNSIQKTINPTIVNTYLSAATNKYVEEYNKTLAHFILKKINNETGSNIIIFPENINPIDANLKNKNNLIIGSFKSDSYYNEFFWNVTDNSVGYYKKQLLMPVGEYEVYLLKYIAKLTRYKKLEAGYATYKRAPKSDEALPFVFKYDDFKISGSICSENISPYIHRKSTLLGSNLIVNVLSHGPLHGSALLLRQTIAVNSTRALENGRYVITASNYDKSFVVTDEGDIINMSQGKELYSFFRSEIKLKNYITPYIKYGDYIVYISGLFLLIFGVLRKRAIYQPQI